MERYFSKDYSEARQRFLAGAEARPIAIATYENPARGPAGEALFTDVARIGPASARRVLVLESGLHGVEGYAGSAIQLAALESVELPADGDVALLLVHAINPWGFASNCRFNEDNIDLNRHFIDWDVPGNLDNPGYRDIADFLIPADFSAEALAASDAKLESYRQDKGEQALRSAIKLGQYSHPEGLYFGGMKPSWSARTVQRIAEEHLRAAEFCGLIDVHTGLGPFGFGECLSGMAPDSEEGQRCSAWYGHVAHTKSPKTDYAGSAASILDGYKRAAPWPVWTPIGLEFGTRSEQVVRDAVRFDGWLHLNGGASNPRASAVKAMMLHAYRPDEAEWRAAVVTRGQEVVGLGLAGISGEGLRPRPA
ncbi:MULTISPECIES: DUF2817 domain-containing protein [unclassified Chelatococcus]|uniref:DUF2817 domain-containing protein n=1 Tax=unclassified Chelatococcus TaxID=2638111 RepID=UPI001BCD8123|nr:DUF2817 domain-containing protein [Chelatococcus sp.]MBS7742242.1 DUF2817 domain-containing protein [Chelatococcus sp. HY11]CAH1657915.1 conserved hypothetical protein [Hyphomicrobiales bacterium]MBX3542640.1 DUF2817 domain-containing protein [Chelatococcus sp.]MCO5075144.1 M14 family metallopeptidase [Chelatococcus sp.]CAH1689447.1 conserved hypothetical protein [Hyphomicrobiales bacterium]